MCAQRFEATHAIVGDHGPARCPGLFERFVGDAECDEEGVARRCGFDVVRPRESWDSPDEEDFRFFIVGQPHVLTVNGQHPDAVVFERRDPYRTSVFHIVSSHRGIE